MRGLIALTQTLEQVSPLASTARQTAEGLLRRCDGKGRLADGERTAMLMLVAQLENALA
ncbi:hypothetical protein [Archangium violaceum]|uniref:hypothetical protein n=1 Tax=Archangium violaceum TaxID=83451 RepID=UPI001EF0C52C|nr:hypothetical protein [Archangium violaceum]